MDNVMLAFLYTFLAGISTGIGSLIAFFIKEVKPVHMAIFMGFSAGVMIYISFAELLFTSIIDIGFANASLFFFIGIALIAVIDFLLPHEYEEEHSCREIQNKGLLKAGMLIAIGIAIHNFPEGMAMLFSTLKDPQLGLLLVVAIALHNIPEGISVSFPIYCATNSRKKAFLWSFASGLAEPLGALIGFFIIFPFLTPYILSAILAVVAGIMIFISFDELIPISLRTKEEHIAVASVFFGMLFSAFTIILLNYK